MNLENLQQALEAASVTVSAEVIPALEKYCQLLWEKNQHVNLTRHATYTQFVNRDLFDTLQLSQLLVAGEDVLDVGTGGGVPGMVLAILRPDLNVELAESVGKKALILKEFCKTLGLNVPVHSARAEDVLELERFDTVTARAVGPLAKLFRWFDPVWANMRRLLAIKGPRWKEERLEAEHQRLMRYLILKVAARYPIPGEDWESVILEIRHTP